MSFIWFLLSFVICALGQPSRVPFLGFFASFIGYGLLWWVIRDFRRPLISAFIWFFLVSLVQLSWLSDPSYCTNWIYLAYLAYSALLAFGFLLGTWTIFKGFHPLAIAASFTIIEWLRSFILSGLPFNPAGLHLVSCFYPMQMAAYIGILGLSFWVYLANSYFLQSLKKRNLFSFGLIVLLPFVCGFIHYQTLEHVLGDHMNVALIQTKTAPWRKGNPTKDLHLAKNEWENWENILMKLGPLIHKSLDLIVLPEGAFVMALPKRFFLEDMNELFTQVFGLEIENSFPLLSERNSLRQGEQVFVNGVYCCQTLANFFNADLICGFDDLAGLDKTGFVNAAFLFRPLEKNYQRYEKRLLVPLVEYLPFALVSKIAHYFDIYGGFEKGEQAKVFHSKWKYGISICYEEVFSHIGRSIGKLKSDVLINISNDAWFPRSNLAEQQKDLARVRSVELGLPFLRCNNIGGTSFIDRFGQVIHEIKDEPLIVETISLAKHPTIYVLIGDLPLLILCFSFILVLFVVKTRPLALNRRL